MSDDAEVQALQTLVTREKTQKRRLLRGLLLVAFGEVCFGVALIWQQNYFISIGIFATLPGVVWALEGGVGARTTARKLHALRPIPTARLINR